MWLGQDARHQNMGARFVSASEVEDRWLEYAWAVLNTPDRHRAECIAGGGAVPGPGRVDGNELRWPGYLGARYEPGRSVLCVGAVHREATLELHADPVIASTDREFIDVARAWLRSGRSAASDAEYLDGLRAAYVRALPSWSRWKRHFRPLVEDYLGMDRTQIAWANLAKCRVSIDRGSKQRAAEGVLTPMCQRQYPMADLVEASRPVAVLVAVLQARPGGDIVRSWSSQTCSPVVYTWQGQSGHDRHNTAPGARPLRQWAPEMAEQVRAAAARS